MSIYCPLSEALGIDPGGQSVLNQKDDDIDMYDHIMCRVPGVPHDEISKKLISEKTKAYWKTPAGIEKKKRLIAWNKKTKSEVMKRLQKERPDMFYRGGRPKGSKDLQKRKPSVRRKPRKVCANGIIYKTIYEASELCGISVSGIKKRCQRNSFGWSYIDG